MQKLKNKIQLTSIDYTKNLNTLKYILTDAKRKFNDQICTGEHFITISKIHDDFNCLICLNVVREPKECQKCDKLFCNDCISKWK